MPSVEHGGTHALGGLGHQRGQAVRSGLHRGLRIMLGIAGCGDICAITVAPPKISPRVFSDKLERFWRLHFATLDIFGWSEISPIPHWDDPKTCPMLS